MCVCVITAVMMEAGKMDALNLIATLQRAD